MENNIEYNYGVNLTNIVSIEQAQEDDRILREIKNGSYVGNLEKMMETLTNQLTPITKAFENKTVKISNRLSKEDIKAKFRASQLLK